MLKKSAIRRMFTATLALFIVSVLYFFPNSKDLSNIKQTTNYIDIPKSSIYLVNKDEYVVKTTIPLESKDDIDEAKKLLDALTIGSNNDALPKNLLPIIPKNTKVLNISLKMGLLKINFSKEFLNVTKDNEEKLIEAIVYTLTENKNISSIMIFIEEEKLDYLPQTKKKLPTVLDRSFGINKIYDIASIKNLTKTTIYYIGKTDDLVYYVPVTKIDNNKNNKIEIIINELKSSPTYETNLISYLASSVKLLNYENLENQLNLTFNNEIFADLNDETILEEVKYSISYSLQDSLNIEKVNFLVDGKVISTFTEN